MRALAGLCALLAMLASGALAQDAPVPAVLVADTVTLTQDRVLIARGNVEAFQGQTRLRAAEIRYDSGSGQLDISGPITIEEGDEIVILADQAQLSNDLETGLLVGARMVLSQQLQLASAEMNLVGGRYSQLYKTAVTSCRVCEDGRPPLWSIRAQKIIHDQEERQLYFDNVQFRIGHVPILYLPRLRLPDPTLRRATGFLAPSLRTTSQLGTGIKVPYFIKLGDYRDLTLTPYLSSSTTTLEFRYRQNFKRGRIRFEGAMTRDELIPNEDRGYVFGTGAFGLNNGYQLTFNIQATSDDGYLEQYGYSDRRRLTSQIALTRARRDEWRELSYTNVKSLRDDEDNLTLPSDVFDAIYERRVFPKALGGELRLSAAAHSHFRASSLDIDGPDADTIVDGRDVLRVNVGAHWLRTWTYASGLQLQTTFGLEADAFQIRDDSTFPTSDAGLTPQAAVTFRYPMIRRGDGNTQILEPIVQLAYVGGNDLNIPNEESTRAEFDEGNLLALSRFPAPDRRDRGAAMAVGLNWSRFSDDGWQARLSLGQVIRRNANVDYSETSGLSGDSSDLLVAGQLSLAQGLSISARGFFDGNLEASKAEFRGAWASPTARVAASYIWLTDDLAEDRPAPVSEVNVFGGYNINKHWSLTSNWRYDLDDDRAVNAGIGLTYDNECVSAKFTVERSYTSSTSVEPFTNLGFRVSLRGFSAQAGTESYARTCKQ
ncbi:MAG: LPS assembly protein LptD [Pseudomonadota bacterium]